MRSPCAGLRLLLTVCLLLCALLATTASASAAVEGQRSHETTPSFTIPVKPGGTSGKKTPEPSAVAVSSATGDVYVAEHDAGVVEQFKPKKNGSGETVGEEFVRTIPVAAPVAVAVDNTASGSEPSSGDVYVATGKGLVFKFAGEGTTLEEEGKLKKFKSESAILGIAVDQSGSVFVSEASGEIAKLNDEASNALVSRVKTELPFVGSVEGMRRGLALDSLGNFYVGSAGFSGEEGVNNLLTHQREEFEEINPEYLGTANYAVLAKLAGSGEILVPAVSSEPIGAVAANAGDGPGADAAERNDVYTVELTGAPGEKVSRVSEYAPSSSPKQLGQLLQSFVLPSESGNSEGAGIALNSATGELYVLDAAAFKVDVYKFAPAGKPSITALSAQSSSTAPGTWALSAQVNANGSDTHYHFEYGVAGCGAPTFACVGAPSADLGATYGPQAVSQQLTGLPAGTYHYRVIAESSLGTVDSAEQTFTIAATLASLPDGRAWELVSPPNKNGSEPEALTREGGVIQASEGGEAITYVADGPFNGQKPEGVQSPIPTQQLSTRGPGGWTSTDINTADTVANGIQVGLPREFRAFSPNLALSLVEPITTSGALAQPPFAPSETKQKSIYLRADAPLTPEVAESASFAKALKNGEESQNAGFVALVNSENASIFANPEFGAGSAEGGLELEDATPDLSHVVFRSISDSPGLYEWVGAGKPLERVGVLPNGAVEPNARLGLAPEGGQGSETDNAISSNGSRVIWTTPSVKHLYMRDTETHETVQLDAFQTKALEEADTKPGTTEKVKPGADFAAASTDGSKVFFTDIQRLTSDSHATARSPDLYVYEFGALGATLRDLTPQPGAELAVKNYVDGSGVLGASGDGSYVYFVANGVLAPGASRGGCPHETGEPRPTTATCNLYVSHLAGSTWETKLVATLSLEDVPDWGDLAEGNLSQQTSRVSPNGQYLAFMSNRNLSGYETVEAGSPQRDEQVYLYNASTESVTCASCNPTGAPPVGVHDVGPNDSGESPEGLGLVVDRPQTWAVARKGSFADHWLAGSVPGWTSLSLLTSRYQSRYLTNNGSLFFNSPGQLASGATGEKEKVYEYEQKGAGACITEGGCIGLISGANAEHESAFLDASTNGNNVFFVSAQPLVPNPEDNFSVYDAHICEAASPCSPAVTTGSAPCNEEALTCRKPPPPFTSGPGSAASENTSGAGNLVPQIGKVQVLPAIEKAKPKPLTRAQKLAKALKACKKDKQKKKRVACEKSARKKYGSPAKKASHRAGTR
jgi:WD40-like Beta Propeller Repeat